MSEWVSVDEGLPDVEGDYIVCRSGLVSCETFYGYTANKKTPRWSLIDLFNEKPVTHWMPLPEPPNQA